NVPTATVTPRLGRTDADGRKPASKRSGTDQCRCDGVVTVNPGPLRRFFWTRRAEGQAASAGCPEEVACPVVSLPCICCPLWSPSPRDASSRRRERLPRQKERPVRVRPLRCRGGPTLH